MRHETSFITSVPVYVVYFDFRDIDEKSVQKVCSRVAEWVVGCQDGAILTIQQEGKNNSLSHDISGD